MKLNINMMLLITVLIFSFMLPSFFINGEDVIAYLSEVGGTVKIMNNFMNKNTEGKAGMLLNPGDVITTGENSYASVVFQDDGSRIKLGENATLTLNAKRKKISLRKKLFLKTGRLWAKVTKRRGTEFQVTTPTSVASVKGTRFIIEEDKDGVTWLWVLEDKVKFSNGKMEVEVNEGEKGKSTKSSVDVEPVKEGEIPIEPGIHRMIFYFNNSENTGIQKELQIEIEK